jgi:hypothetical protein
MSPRGRFWLRVVTGSEAESQAWVVQRQSVAVQSIKREGGHRRGALEVRG